MTVVGTAVVNSTDEGSPGLGAVLSPEGLRELLPRRRRRPSSSISGTASLAGALGRSWRPPSRASSPGRCDNRPCATWNASALCLGCWPPSSSCSPRSLAHALVLLIGRQRGQLAVLKTLGFTPRQVSSTVAQATALVVVAAVVGAVGGALVARIGWRAVVDRLGVVSPAVVPPFALALVILGAVVFANLVAIWPGRRAAAIRPSEALRSE